jgi:hypothetical protein
MPLDPRRVQAIFWEAVQYPDPADRAVILERECSADAVLRQRVARLLEAHDEYDGFANEPAGIPRVGPWSRRLGHDVNGCKKSSRSNRLRTCLESS